MRSMRFSIEGKPTQWQRRVVTKAGFSFMPKEVTSYKCIVRDAYRTALDKQEGVTGCGYTPHDLAWTPHDGPVSLTLWAFFPIPRYRPSWWKEIARHELMPMIKVPDFDNLGKIIGDALNQIAWVDDKLIYDHSITKMYSARPRTDIQIEFHELPKRGDHVPPIPRDRR